VISPDRRADDRRRYDALGEPLERKKERREGDRREAPRAQRRVWLVDPAEPGIPQAFEGEVSLQGASYDTLYPPMSTEVQLCFRLGPEEVHLPAIVERIHDTRVMLKFRHSIEDELKLARWIDSQG
jgi:hypothetical protein